MTQDYHPPKDLSADGGAADTGLAIQKSEAAYRSISEVATLLSLPSHVLRFWETKFPQIKPLKRRGGRRFYGPEDVRFLRIIQRLLHDEGYTIKGVQKLLDENAIDLTTGQLNAGANGPIAAADNAAPATIQSELVEMLAELQEIRSILTSN